MTLTLETRSPRYDLRGIWRDARPVERLAVVVGVALFLSGLVHLGVLVATRSTWQGPLSYRKATTFGLSFGLTLVTVAWAQSFLPMPRRRRNVLLGAFTAACVLETFLVTMQVWRGVPSHFDFETPFDTVVSMSLAFGGAVIILCALGMTATALRAPGSPSMTLALRFGFVTLMISLVIGAVMIAHGVTLARSGHPQQAYHSAGSLKPLHAVTLHAILVVPAVAWLLGRTGVAEPRRLRAVRSVVVAYSALIVAVAVALSW